MKAKIRVAAGVTAVAIAAGSTAVMVGASNQKYENDYTIENVLSDYIYFTSGNLNAPTHIVGAVAVGGSATLNSWGDAQISPTYIANIVSYSGFASSPWVGDLWDNNVYYDTINGEIPEDEASLPSGFKRNADYVDFATAMTQIQKQSDAIAQSATKIETVTVKDLGWLQLNYITIDVAQYDTNSFEIPYEIYAQADVIDFIDSTNADFGAEDFAKDGYRISITGVNGNPIIINYQGGSVTSSTDAATAYIKINDSDINFKNNTGSEQGGQLNMTGTQSMLNFPDATGDIIVHYTQGHVVAPNANVSAGYGTVEGGIIAKHISAPNEGHFYPYYPNGTRNTYEEGGVDAPEETTTTTTTTQPTTTTTTTEPTTTTTTTQPTTTTTTTNPTTTTTTTEATTTRATTPVTSAGPTTTTTTTQPTTTTTMTNPTTTTTTTEATTTIATTPVTSAGPTTTTTTTTNPTTTTTTTEATTTIATTLVTSAGPTTTTTTTQPTTTTTMTNPTTMTTTTEVTTTIATTPVTSAGPTTTTTTTQPTTTTTNTTTESTSIMTTTADTEETTTTAASTTVDAGDAENTTTTTTVSSEESAVTTTTENVAESTTTTTYSNLNNGNDGRTPANTTANVNVGNSDNNRTTASENNNATESKAPGTGAKYTSIAVTSLLTAAAVIALGKKKFGDKD